MSETKFQQKLRERKEREAAAAAAKESAARVAEMEASTWAADLIPDGDDKPRTATDTELDRLLGGISVVEAYHRWCGKMKVDRRRRTTEGIKVSCPVPGHRDANPSAWLNTDKNVWFCAPCDRGGDVYDLAAFHFGFEVPGYKAGGNFHELRKKMAESYGYTFITPPGLDKPILVPPEKAKEHASTSIAKRLESPVTDLDKARIAAGEAKALGVEVDEDTEAEIVSVFGDRDDALPSLDWKKLVKEGTFLDTYMDICTKDDAPEEYHFWNGLLALGLTVGRTVKLDDQKQVIGNLFVCLLGPTGDGKSRSNHHLDELLYQALPYRTDDPSGKGVEILDSVASAEALISGFVNPVFDPTDPKRLAGYTPVKAMIKFDELSSLVGRASRKGNVLKPTLMEIYDGKRVIQTMSLTHGRKRAENPFGSLFTTSQPGALKHLLREDDAASGFLNRIVFATATPKTRIPIGGVAIDVAPAVDPLNRIQGWAGFGRLVTWSDEAVRTFTEFFHEVLHPAQQADETGLLNRMDLLAKKLVLLLCINEHALEVRKDTVDQVASMFSYLTAAYGVPAAHIGSTINSEVRDEIMKHVRRHSAKGGITLRLLRGNISRKNFPLDIVSKTLKYLVDLGYIEAQVTAGTRGPSTVRYKAAND